MLRQPSLNSDRDQSWQYHRDVLCGSLLTWSLCDHRASGKAGNRNPESEREWEQEPEPETATEEEQRCEGEPIQEQGYHLL